MAVVVAAASASEVTEAEAAVMAASTDASIVKTGAKKAASVAPAEVETVAV